MSRACAGGSDGQTDRRIAGAPWAADGLALAAAPTFALMALLTGVLDGGPAAMLCAAAHGSPLGGMVTMYLLMSAFHAGPWLKLIRASAATGRSAKNHYEERSRISGTGTSESLL